MIKIIKPGKINRVLTCKNCECEFSYDTEDVNTVASGDSWVAYVVCPCCSEGITVNSSKEQIITKDESPKVPEAKVGEVTPLKSSDKKEFENKIYPRSPIFGDYFHGECWYKCPQCGKSFEAYDTEFEKGFTIVDKSKRLYQHECGCVIHMS